MNVILDMIYFHVKLGIEIFKNREKTMRGFVAAILACSVIFLPAFAFTAPLVLPEYEIESNLSHQGDCNAGRTEIKVYQNEIYYLGIFKSHDGDIYYILSKNLDDGYHYFVKNAKGVEVEIDKDVWYKKFNDVIPNEKDCSIKKIKK